MSDLTERLRAAAEFSREYGFGNDELPTLAADRIEALEEALRGLAHEFAEERDEHLKRMLDARDVLKADIEKGRWWEHGRSLLEEADYHDQMHTVFNDAHAAVLRHLKGVDL